MGFVAALALIGLGLLNIFAKDFMWGLTQFGNEMKGVASERTDTWDAYTTIGGVFAIVLGIVVLFIAIR